MNETVKMNGNKMGTAPVNQLLLSMAWPMILSMLVGACYNVVDSLFISHYSENALTAVSLAFSIQTLIVAIGTGVGVGANALLATHLGRNEKEKADLTAKHSLIVGLLFYLIVMLFGVFLTERFFLLQTTDSEIVAMGTSYLRIVCIFSFCQIFELVLEKLLQATGHTSCTMITQMVGAIVNIVLDPILIFGLFGLPKMGAAGAAIATVTGQFIAMALGVLFNLTRNKEIDFSFKNFKFDSVYLVDICKLGVPTIIMNSMTSVMSFGVNKILLSYTSTAAAVFGAYFKIQTFVYMAVFGLNTALLSIVAFNKGAGNPDRIKKVIRLAGVYSAIIGLIGTAIMFLLPEQLIGAFSPSESMLEIGTIAFRILSLTFIFGSVTVMVSYALQGFARGVSSLVVSALRQVILLLPLAVLFSAILGLEGVWIGYLVAEVISFAVAVVIIKIVTSKECSALIHEEEVACCH